MQKIKKESKDELVLNNNLPTLYIDGFSLSRRKDKMNLLRLGVTLPEMTSEQVRVMFDEETMKSMVDTFCESINYYPEHPKKTTKAKKCNKKVE
jgi:hypothetical protein